MVVVQPSNKHLEPSLLDTIFISVVSTSFLVTFLLFLDFVHYLCRLGIKLFTSIIQECFETLLILSKGILFCFLLVTLIYFYSSFIILLMSMFFYYTYMVLVSITKIRQIRRDSKLIIEEVKSNKILDFRAHPDTPMLSDIVTASAK